MILFRQGWTFQMKWRRWRSSWKKLASWTTPRRQWLHGTERGWQIGMGWWLCFCSLGIGRSLCHGNFQDLSGARWNLCCFPATAAYSSAGDRSEGSSRDIGCTSRHPVCRAAQFRGAAMLWPQFRNWRFETLWLHCYTFRCILSRSVE